ncbi:hypothetical protein [Paenibacillus sp. NFR01]|uniref:hypothetical protein n=1 Tax=Paenibacillus sp. NFR01 TaxID=1566279 RepID=UPI0008BE1B48|nr:hypothetical protein [Paenibacillus sp. NFR01]SET49142.1 hypothetical protein SAMN03159358_1835 [Paenibacillus sp. NFR01]
MDNVIFIGIGVIDAFAVLTLILKLFMLPVGEYRNKLLIFATFISLFSFTMRMVLGIPAFDLPLQYVLFVLFYRFVMQIKVHIATFIAGAGINAYAIIQLSVYYLYVWSGITHTKILSENVGLQVYIVQATAILVTLLISFALSKLGYGFSFIIVPPHDFLRKENYFSNKNLAMIATSTISLFTVFVMMVLLYAAEPLGLLAAAAVAFGLSFYFSRWSDKDDTRKAVEAYRAKNKAV